MNGDPRAYSKEQARHRNTALLRYYGITLDEYIELFDRQKGVCAICGTPPKRRALHVDHGHKTGDVRGLLCWNCNKMLRSLNDDPLRAESAAEYLSAKPFREGTAVIGSTRKSTKGLNPKRYNRCGTPLPRGGVCECLKDHRGVHRRRRPK